MLYQWQARILNKLYKTKQFEQLIDLQIQDVKQLNYSQVFHVSNQINHNQQPQALIQCANILTQAKASPKLLQGKVKELDEYLKTIDGEYSIEHVVAYSCLSKCRIWPKVLKSGKGLVPDLINFYNKFTEDHNEELDFKFDPVILSRKYTNIMKKVQNKKKDHPQLAKAVLNGSIQEVEMIIGQITKKLQEMELDVIEQLNKIRHQQKHLTHMACQSSLEMVQYFYKIGLDFEALDKELQTPLFYAVKKGSIPMLQFLVEKIKVNINHQEFFNRTAFYLAAFEGNLEVVDYLYKMGANPQISSKLDRTPLSKACYLGKVNVVQYLVKSGVQLTFRDSRGRTALHNSVWGREGGRDGKRSGQNYLEDSPQSAKILLQAGHPIDFPDYDGFTPLFSAVASCAVKSVRLLHEYKADFTYRTLRQQTICFVGAKYGHLQVLQILIDEYGCDYTSVDVHGYSPLCAAITLTDDKGRVFSYLANKYVEKECQFNFPMLLDCLKSYPNQENTFLYLIDWMDQHPQKIKHIHRQLMKDQFSLFLANQHQFNNLNLMLRKIMEHYEVPQKFLLSYIDKCTGRFNCRQFPLYVQFLQFLRGKKIHVQINNLQLHISLPDKDLAKLLTFDTNLTADLSTIKHNLFKMVEYRMTAGVLALFSTNNKYGQGLYRYKYENIIGLMKQHEYQSLNLIDFCTINGINDIGTLLSHQKQFHASLSSIPQYSYQSHLFKDNAITLKPVHPDIFNVKKVLESTGEAQSHCYSTFIEKQYCFNPSKNNVIVDSAKLFQFMQVSVFKHSLIGIDVEYYNSKEEQFVCSVQISHTQAVFLLDPFHLSYQRISQFLNKLLSSDQIKIFHAYDNDLRWLHEDFNINKFHLNNVVDTSRIEMELCSHSQSSSLKSLSQKWLKFHMKKDYQRADWRLRPLFKEMIEYASLDAEVLPYIFLSQIQQLGSNTQSKFFKDERIIKSRGIRNHVSIKSRAQDVI